MKMNLFFRSFVSVIFIVFGLLQYNDPDVYIWTFLYFSIAIIFFLKTSILDYLHLFLLSICSILFIKNINILITSKQIQDEIFYELGGIVLILIASYFKFSNKE